MRRTTGDGSPCSTFICLPPGAIRIQPGDRLTVGRLTNPQRSAIEIVGQRTGKNGRHVLNDEHGAARSAGNCGQQVRQCRGAARGNAEGHDFRLAGDPPVQERTGSSPAEPSEASVIRSPASTVAAASAVTQWAAAATAWQGRACRMARISRALRKPSILKRSSCRSFSALVFGSLPLGFTTKSKAPRSRASKVARAPPR